MSVLSPSPPLRELTGRQIQWIGAGYVMMFSSVAGQTVFIAQFNTSLRQAFSLSDGQFGLVYTLSTLASSVLLIWAGALADRLAPRLLALVCMAGLAAVSVGMSLVDHVVVLGILIFGLRFFGQGMMVHIAMTTMSRWFNRFRGRALAFAQFGFPTAEASLPFFTTLAIAAFGWRQVWVAVATVLIIVLMPLLTLLLRNPPDGRRAKAQGLINPDGDTSSGPTGENWTRGAVLKDPIFFALIPGFMASPAIVTLFLFHQANLSALKGWDLTLFTAFFPFLSLTTVLTSIMAGILVDRFGAWRIVPFVLIPLGIGALGVGLFDPVWVVPGLFICFGLTGGLMSPVVGALWAELYGTAHIGAIRALATSALVLASAIGPGIAGGLIDAGIPLDKQAFVYAAFCFVAVIGYLMLMPALKNRITALG